MFSSWIFKKNYNLVIRRDRPIKNTYFTDNVTIDCQPLEILRRSVEADVEDSRKLWAQGGCPDVVGDRQDARKHWHPTCTAHGFPSITAVCWKKKTPRRERKFREIRRYTHKKGPQLPHC